MGLKAKVVQAYKPAGFIFAPSKCVYYPTLPDFQKALRAQEQATALLDSQVITDLDIDGNLIGTEDMFGDAAPLRLSRNAFSDLCRLSKIGESFVKRRSLINENLTLALMRDCINHEFRDGDYKLLVNTTDRRVESIVEADSHAHLSNAKALEYALSVQNGLTLSQAWIDGASARFALLDKQRPATVRVGDVVHFGVSIKSYLSKGTGFFDVIDYNERLVCSNGMLRTSNGAIEEVPMVSDIRFNLQRAILGSHKRSSNLAPRLQFAATKLLTAEDVRDVRKFLEDSVNGGSPKFAQKIIERATKDSVAEGRDACEPTLWNFVNAVTEAAHDTDSLTRRDTLESMGYNLLTLI